LIRKLLRSSASQTFLQEATGLPQGTDCSQESTAPWAGFSRNLAGQPAFERVRAELGVRLQALRVQYSGVASGFSEWIATQRESTANWEGYHAQYRKLKAHGSHTRK
jgi:hypothetical protein